MINLSLLLVGVLYARFGMRAISVRLWWCRLRCTRVISCPYTFMSVGRRSDDHMTGTFTHKHICIYVQATTERRECLRGVLIGNWPCVRNDLVCLKWIVLSSINHGNRKHCWIIIKQIRITFTKSQQTNEYGNQNQSYLICPMCCICIRVIKINSHL